MIVGILVFIFGLIIGSFLNAFLYRFQEKKSLTGRSFCPSCKHTLSWNDLVPVFSWLFLAGECRYCKRGISIQYPLVELLTAFLFLAFGLSSGQIQSLNAVLMNFGLSLPLSFDFWNLLFSKLMLIVLFLIASLLILISVYDLKTKEIPNNFNAGFAISAALYFILLNLNSPFIVQNSMLHLLSGLGAFLFFWFFVVISNETWMGGGDAKLAFGMGLFLGPANTFLAILIATWTGAIFGISMLIVEKAKASRKELKPVTSHLSPKHEIPFGPFLVLGTIISFLFGSPIIAWYAKIFLGM